MSFQCPAESLISLLWFALSVCFCGNAFFKWFTFSTEYRIRMLSLHLGFSSIACFMWMWISNATSINGKNQGNCSGGHLCYLWGVPNLSLFFYKMRWLEIIMLIFSISTIHPTLKKKRLTSYKLIKVESIP